LIAVTQLTLQLTPEMPMMHGILATFLLIAAAFYSLQVVPNDLRLMLARVVPILSSQR
jgi:hypothetical protein